jgi:hypothetical protein
LSSRVAGQSWARDTKAMAVCVSRDQLVGFAIGVGGPLYFIGHSLLSVLFFPLALIMAVVKTVAGSRDRVTARGRTSRRVDD